MLICEARCGRGAIRRENQDNLILCGRWRDTPDDLLFTASARAAEGLFAVCDGMGGEEFGAEASLLAARALARVPAEEFARSSGRLLEQVNGAICALMRQKQARIGTTFAGLWVCGGRAGAVNLGDSRVYRLRANALERLSRDHTHVQRLLDMGAITPQQAAMHPGRHRLTQHLGIFPEELIIQPQDTGPFALFPGDRFLLCSDGLTDMLSEPEIAALLAQSAGLAQAADGLYQGAMARGGRDNITVLLVENAPDV